MEKYGFKTLFGKNKSINKTAELRKQEAEKLQKQLKDEVEDLKFPEINKPIEVEQSDSSLKNIQRLKQDKQKVVKSSSGDYTGNSSDEQINSEIKQQSEIQEYQNDFNYIDDIQNVKAASFVKRTSFLNEKAQKELMDNMQSNQQKNIDPPQQVPHQTLYDDTSSILTQQYPINDDDNLSQFTIKTQTSINQNKQELRSLEEKKKQLEQQRQKILENQKLRHSKKKNSQNEIEIEIENVKQEFEFQNSNSSPKSSKIKNVQSTDDKVNQLSQLLINNKKIETIEERDLVETPKISARAQSLPAKNPFIQLYDSIDGCDEQVYSSMYSQNISQYDLYFKNFTNAQGQINSTFEKIENQFSKLQYV